MDTVQTFANRFRKTDEYSNLNLSDSELTEKVLDEYPMYADLLGQSSRKSNAFAESFKQFGLGTIETLGNVAEGVIDNYALGMADLTMTEEEYNKIPRSSKVKYEDYVLRNEEKLEGQRKAMALSDSIDSFVRNDLADIMNVDPRFQQSFTGQLFRGLGQYLGYGTAGLVGTAASLGNPMGGIAAVYGTAFLNRQAAFIEDAEATLKKKFVDMSADEKDKVAKGSLGYGILTGALDATVFKYVTGKAGTSLLNALKGGGSVSSTTLKTVLGNAAIAATAEGTQESIGDGMVLDILAKNLYDDDREFITGDALSRRALEFGLGAAVGGIARGGIDTFGIATGRGIQVEGVSSEEAKSILEDSEADEDVANKSDDGRKNFKIGFNTISGLPETATIEAANEEEAIEVFKTQYKGLYELDGNLSVNEEVAEDSPTTVESEEETVGSETVSDDPRLEDRSYQVPLEQMNLPDIDYDDIDRTEVSTKSDEELQELIDKEYNSKVVKEDGTVLIGNIDFDEQSSIDRNQEMVDDGDITQEKADQLNAKDKKKYDRKRRTVARAKKELEARARGEVKQQTEAEYLEMLDNLEKGKLKTRIGGTPQPTVDPTVSYLQYQSEEEIRSEVDSKFGKGAYDSITRDPPRDPQEALSTDPIIEVPPRGTPPKGMIVDDFSKAQLKKIQKTIYDLRQGTLEFDARAVYIPKKYMGKTPKAENKFFNRFNPEQYTEGKFIDIDTGRDLTDQSFQNMRLKIVEGKASLETSDIPDVDPKTIPANIKTKDQGYVKIGTQIQTNLLRPDRWKWKEKLFGITPEQEIQGSIISVEQGSDHFYTLDYEVNNPVKLENLPQKKVSPQGRPITRGKLDFGLPVGYITVGNKEHPLYAKITVGRSPYIKKQDLQRMSDALTPEQKQKNFDEWFGNSQIVQGDGSPKVVYHGTNLFDIKDPTTARFKEEAIGSMHDDGWYGRGFYFADTQGEASTYGQKVASVYLSVQNPFFFDSAPEDSIGRYETFYKAGFRNPTIDTFAEKFKEYKLMLEKESMIDTDGGLQIDTIDDGLGRTRFEIHRTGEDQPTDVLNQTYQYNMGEAIREAAVELASNDILAEDLDPNFMLDEIARAFNYNRASAFVRMYSEDSSDFTNKVKALGFDGIVVNDETVVFEPTQIKEVRNTGLFGKQESLIFQARQPKYNEGFLGDYNNEVEDGDEAPNHKVRKARMVNYFSGMSTVQAVLGDRAETIVAVEYEQPIVDEYNKYYGTDISTTDIRDLDVQQSVNAKPDIFWTSPPCCNFSLANPNKTPNEVDLAAAKKSAETIRRAKPKVVVIENAPKYQTTKLYKDNILKALKEEGYSISEDIIQAADYGADSDRRRLIVRAVRDGEVPPLPKKTGVTGDWYARVSELIDSAPDTVIGEKEMANIKEGIRTGRLKADLPIITMGTNKGSNRNAGSPAPTLTSNLARLKDGSIVSRAIARILMPDGSMKEVTPLMMARIMNIPDGFSIGKMDINNLPRGLARVMLGNGVQGKVTENVIVPLLESQNLFQDQPTADTIDKEVPNGTPTNLIFEVGNQPMQGPKVQRKIINKNIPSIKMSDLAGERVFVMAMDRMGVGTYRGYTPNSPIKIPMMGGAGFSHIPAMQKSNVAWAFSGKGAHTAIGNRAKDSTSGIGLQYLMSADNHIGNETFAEIYVAELNLAIREGRISKENALEILNEKRKQEASNKSITGIEYELPINSVKDLKRLLDNGTFNTRRALMQKLMLPTVAKAGMPDVNKMVVSSSDGEFTGMNTGTVVSAIQVDQNDLKQYSANDLKVPTHSSYPLLIKGKGLGYFDQPFDFFEEVKHLERAAQAGKKYGEASKDGQTQPQVRAAAIKAFEGERRTYGVDPKGLILSASEQQEFNTVEERIEANEIKKYVLEKFGSIVDNPMLSYRGKKLKFIINRKHKGPAQYRFPEHVIAINPRALGMYGMDTEKSLSQVVREEIVHATGVLIVIKNKTRKSNTDVEVDVEVTKGFFENLSSDLSSADIDSIQQVYADGRTMDEYNRGAEFFRAVIQKNVYGIITEEATLRNAENQLKYLFKQIQKFFADLYAKTKTFDPELAAIVNQTVDLLRTVDPDARPAQQQIVMEARSMVDENGDKQITPESFTNTEPEDDKVIVNDGKNLIVTGKDKGLKLGQRVIVPVGTLLNRIDPRLAKVFRDFLDAKEGRILDAHTRAQNFAKKFKKITNKKDLDLLSILVSFSKFDKNSNITEEQADKLYRQRDALLRKYNMYNEYQGITTLLRMIRTEAVGLGMEIGDLDQYFPRSLSKKGLKALRDKYGITITTFKGEIERVNRIRAKNMTKYNQVYVMVNGVETAGNRYDIKQVKEANANAAALGGEVRVIEMPGKPLPAIEPGSKEETELLEDLIHRGGYDMKKGKPRFTKTRMIELIKESDIQYYNPPYQALSQYFNSMLTWIEATKFAGRIKPVTSTVDGVVRIDMSQDKRSSLGKVLTELANDPEVDQELLYQTFPDLFRGFMQSTARELPLLSWLRQFSYGSLLIEFTSTLSQLYDMPFSAYDNGLLTTTIAGLEAATGKSYANAKDLLDKSKIIDAYQTGNDFFGDIINFGLTVSGFRAMDQLMKTTTMNAVYKRLTRVSQYYNLDGTLNLNKLEKAPKRVQAEVRRTATQLIKYMPESQVNPSRLPEFIQALRTEETKRTETQHDLLKGMLVTVLAETQPLNALRQPILPTENANFRGVYTMKSFMVTQLDAARTRMLDDVFSKESTQEQRVKGMQELAKLMIFFVMLGVPIDLIKDLLVGRMGYMSDYVFNSMTRVFGINKFMFYSIRNEGIGEAAMDFVTPVPLARVLDTTNQMSQILQGSKTFEQSGIWRTTPFSDLWTYRTDGAKEKMKKQMRRRESGDTKGVLRLFDQASPRPIPITREMIGL